MALKNRESVEKASVLEAARQWFEKDKANNLTPELKAILEKIVNEVIGARKARSFLLPRELEDNQRINSISGCFEASV